MIGFKTNKVQFRFIVQIVLTIILLILIGGSAAIILKNIQRAEGNLAVAASMNNEYYKLESDIKQSFELAIVNPLNTTIFFRNIGNNIDAAFEQIDQELKTRSSSHFSDSFVRLKEINDSLLLLHDNLEDVYNEILYSLKERGSSSEGFIASLAQNRIAMAKKIAKFDTSGILIMQLFEIEKYYLATLDQQYSRTLKQINKQIENKISVAHHSAIDEVNTASYKYTESLDAISNINKRISLNSRRGYWGDFQNIIGKIYELNNNYTIELTQYKQRVYWLYYLLFIVLIITFGLLYMYSLSRLLKSIRYPLSESLKVLKHFNKGMVLDIPLPENLKYEFKELVSEITQLSNHLKERTQFVDSLLKENFSKDISLLGTRDTFSKSLLALKKKLEKNQERQEKFNAENNIRRYINEGVANFSDILRKNNNDIEVLCDEYISNLVRYIGAIQGGIFLIREDNVKVLELVSAFAYNRKRYQTKTLKVGEGLLGTCAAEKKSIYLDDIPPDYVYITSGLGDAPPNFLLLLPLVHENEIVGVIELATLQKFKAQELELGNLLAESLASTIISVRQNEQTRILLEKSQQQAAEMAEQEEEMRQNMEELKATQEESARREEEMQSKLDAYANLYATIEYHPDTTIIEINSKTTELTSLTEEEVFGKKHQEIFGLNSKVTKDFLHQVLEIGYGDISETVTFRAQEYQIEMRFTALEYASGKDENIIGAITKFSLLKN